MTTQVQVGDYLRLYGTLNEIVYVKEVPRGWHQFGVVVATRGIGLAVRTVSVNELTTDIVRRADVVEHPTSGTIDHAIEALGGAKFGSIYDMAEIMWSNNLGDTFKGDAYIKSRPITRFIEDRMHKLEDPNTYRNELNTLIGLYAPFASTIRAGNIALTRNAADVKADRQTSMKPGRAFRYMLPKLTDKDISMLAEEWIEITAPRTLTLHTGDKATDFAHCYEHDRADYRNPSTTHYRKSLATSCMQGVYRNYCEGDTFKTASVGEAYASGDFFAVWLEDEAERIAGRVVVGRTAAGLYHGPLYGACEQSLDRLAAHLEGLGSTYSDEDWYNLKLKVIGDADDPIVPYLDGDYHGTIEGDYIVLSVTGGDFTFDDTDGHITQGMVCESCCENVNEDDSYHTDDGVLCESCFNESYVHTGCGDVILLEEAVMAFTKHSYRGGTAQVWVHMDESVYCDHIEEDWVHDCVTYSEVGDTYIPTHRMAEFPELFPEDDDENGPAVERSNGTKYWYLNGERHREDGPAIHLMSECPEFPELFPEDDDDKKEAD
jgi:hypothetical protein